MAVSGEVALHLLLVSACVANGVFAWRNWRLAKLNLKRAQKLLDDAIANEEFAKTNADMARRLAEVQGGYVRIPFVATRAGGSGEPVIH